MKRNQLKLILNDDEIPNTIKREEYDNNSWWYLCGKLENDVGYDKAIAINCKSLGISKETKRYSSITGYGDNDLEIELYHNNPWYEMYYTGIIQVDIEGISKRCIGYFWVTEERTIRGHDKKYGDLSFQEWKQRGLVCYADDLEYIKFAESKYNKRSLRL